jgi:hypothetical protein
MDNNGEMVLHEDKEQDYGKTETFGREITNEVKIAVPIPISLDTGEGQSY